MLKKFATFALVALIQPSAAFAENIASSPQTIKPFEATYSILHKHKQVGEGTRKLEVMPDGTIKYSYHTDIDWLIFSDTRTETSYLTVKKNKVLPSHYVYEREGTGTDKEFEWEYDLAQNSAKNLITNVKMNVNYPENIQDKLSYHFQHRLNMIENPSQDHYVYPVIGTSGSIKSYVYQYDGEEELMLPYGLIKTIRLKREVIDKKRVTYAWFAPELNYLLVKLFQIKGGVEQFEAQLVSHKSL